eukprot:Protomagalhaensia_wolfi_Nauph_80__6162@NODE_903_length_1896_cov_422_543888_g680_i0_p2_GENE_NODE_903_length_1896_cov_422_543888_g680_i0NODE_903_length_1896_cov_422_543888_g680_i0_p2_ORF_typecomplete_len208_score9_35Frataxin_Cyay/PF01491_16/2e16_NODE_903_length_1896_cov_422_543888_g680_i08101433
MSLGRTGATQQRLSFPSILSRRLVHSTLSHVTPAYSATPLKSPFTSCLQSRLSSAVCPRTAGAPSDPRPLLDARKKELELEKKFGGSAAKLDISYNQSANRLLNDLYELMEQAKIPLLANVEYQDGVLSMDFEDPVSGVIKTILINKHYINRQLWYSSPISGGDYFSFANGWVSVRSKLNILQKLQNDIKQLTKFEVPIPATLLSHD